MARTRCRPTPWEERSLPPQARACPECGRRMWVCSPCLCTLIPLQGPVRYHLAVCACHNSAWARFHQPYRPEEEGALALPKPEEEGALALPKSEYGLDALAFLGAARYQQHQSVPEIHPQLRAQEVDTSERTVTNLLCRYQELVGLRLTDQTRLQSVLAPQGKVVLAFDGMQPHVGHQVLWVFRDLLCGEVLLAKSLLSASAEDIGALLEDIGALLEDIREALPVPITGVLTDGQTRLKNALAQALADVAHQLCQFHYLREAAKPI
jgi:hypothetical protein